MSCQHTERRDDKKRIVQHGMRLHLRHHDGQVEHAHGQALAAAAVGGEVRSHGVGHAEGDGQRSAQQRKHDDRAHVGRRAATRNPGDQGDMQSESSKTGRENQVSSAVLAPETLAVGGHAKRVTQELDASNF